ncbi:MAG: hypothetical protein WHX52_22525 [Anaerolineae bacterium]
MYNYASSPKLTNVTFSGSGGRIYNFSSGATGCGLFLIKVGQLQAVVLPKGGAYRELKILSETDEPNPVGQLLAVVPPKQLPNKNGGG